MPLSRLLLSQKVKAEEISPLVHMEGQSSYNDPMDMQFMALNFGGNAVNDVSHTPGDDPNQQVIMAAGSSANQADALPLPWWFQTPKPSHNYVEFLAENSTFLPKAPCEDMLIPSFSGIHAVGGVSEFQRGVLYSSLGNACGSKSTDYSMDMDAWKNARDLKPYYEELVNMQNQINSQYHTSRTENSNGDSYDTVSQVEPRVRIAAPGFVSQPRQNVSKQRACDTDRERRSRISESLNALQELLPQSIEGGQASVLDDVIDYIKLMQLQIKDLSKSRLGGESITEPIIFREGYGHYFCHQQMLNEPLEEMMGKLLETNPGAAMQVLEKKGLLMLPMGFTKELV